MTETVVRTTEELLALRDDAGKIVVEGNLRLECSVSWEVGQKISLISAVGYISAVGDISAGGDINALGNIYWSQMQKPVAKSISCQRVLPHAHQREYWAQRLARWHINMEGCYFEIIPRVLAKLPAILKSKQWTPTERWMLESLKPKKKATPRREE